MNPEGGRAKRLAVVVAVQSLVVAACLLITLYSYWDAHNQAADVHIQFSAIADVSRNSFLTFSEVSSSHNMGLSNSGEWIYVNCTGPYLLYVDVCYNSLDIGASGTLELQVADKPVCALRLEASKGVTCRRLQDFAQLRRTEEVRLYLNSADRFIIKNTTVGLNYMLGGRCED